MWPLVRRLHFSQTIPAGPSPHRSCKLRRTDRLKAKSKWDLPRESNDAVHGQLWRWKLHHLHMYLAADSRLCACFILVDDSRYDRAERLLGISGSIGR